MKICRLLALAAFCALGAPAHAAPPTLDLVLGPLEIGATHITASASQTLRSGEIVFSEAATTADLTVKEFTTHATERMVIDSVSLINPVGYVANSSVFLNVKLLGGAAVLANWSTAVGAEGALTADTWVAMTLNATPANLILAGGTVLSVFNDVTAGADAGALNDHSFGASKVLVRYHYIPAAGSVDATYKIFKNGNRKFLITSVRYLPGATLAAHASNYFVVSLLKNSTSAASWSTLSGAEGTLTSDTWVTMTPSATAADLVVSRDDVLSLSLDEHGTAILGAGRVVIAGRYLEK